jgi:dTDP-glucose pyrophosphorylase
MENHLNDLRKPSLALPNVRESMANDTTIILCGGSINYRDLPINTNESNAMIPVNGKPVIGWILDDLSEKGITEVVVVLREDDLRFRSFLNRAYGQRMNIRIAASPAAGTIVHSLHAGLEAVPQLGNVVRVILGDTLIGDSYGRSEDFVYVGHVADAKRWCLASMDEDDIITDYTEKQNVPGGQHLALAGYYHFLHGEYLGSCVRDCLERSQRELSAVLKQYGARYPLRAMVAKNWHDFGHIDRLADARRDLMQPRFFNSLHVNPVLNTITKISQDSDKLRSELNWYESLPEELRVLTPRILSHHQIDGQLEIVQEYYGYPTLAELYVFSDLNVDAWQSILDRVMRVHEALRRYSGHLDDDAIDAIYWTKMLQRLDETRRQDDYWNDLLGRSTLEYNGNRLLNLPLLKDALHERLAALRRNARVTIIHGDFCFSNILYDINHQIIRLIDPRGSFGKPGIYGDPRYDMAKLRHSIGGLYDYVMADMFALDATSGEFVGEIYSDDKCTPVSQLFDQMLMTAGYQLAEITLIEATLFLSMLPLHRDTPQRQRMFYLIGLSLLNEVLECESSLT